MTWTSGLTVSGERHLRVVCKTINEFVLDPSYQMFHNFVYDPSKSKAIKFLWKLV